MDRAEFEKLGIKERVDVLYNEIFKKKEEVKEKPIKKGKKWLSK